MSSTLIKAIASGDAESIALALGRSISPVLTFYRTAGIAPDMSIEIVPEGNGVKASIPSGSRFRLRDSQRHGLAPDQDFSLEDIRELKMTQYPLATLSVGLASSDDSLPGKVVAIFLHEKKNGVLIDTSQDRFFQFPNLAESKRKPVRIRRIMRVEQVRRDRAWPVVI